jgi:hypothetical protein
MTPRCRAAACPALALLLVCLLSGTGDSGASIAAFGEVRVRVRASEAFAPFLEPALAVFTRETGTVATLEIKDPDPAHGADLVVGDDSELTRVLEGGSADVRTALDLGYIPWVFVSPSGTSPDVRSAAAQGERIVAMGGQLGREARAALGLRLAEGGVRISRDGGELRSARYAMVPRTLAGPGQQQRLAVSPLVAVAAVVTDSANQSGARQLLAFLGGSRGRAILSSYLSATGGTGAPDAQQLGATTGYATAIVDWWLPRCTLEHNGYNDPSEVLGPPDAIPLGGKDQYRGFMSLGQGGYVTVDMGVVVVDGPGADLRVFQTVSNEPVTVYAASKPQGPFVLLGLRVHCGERTGGGVFSFHCDFDLHDSGLTEARYFKIEDGEVFPCMKSGTITEGPDIDAVQVLNQRP